MDDRATGIDSSIVKDRNYRRSAQQTQQTNARRDKRAKMTEDVKDKRRQRRAQRDYYSSIGPPRKR